MFSRNIDFFAVLLIALAFTAFSRIPSVAAPRVPAVRFQQAMAADECPASQIVADISAALNR